MAAKSSPLENTSDREITTTRVFDAPRDLVFSMYTEQEHIEKWWGPRGFRTTTSEMNVKPGGTWRFIMHGPDGRDYKNRIVYMEVDRPSLLVYKHDPEKGTEPVNFEVTITFIEKGDKTEVNVRMLFPSVTARDYVAKAHGAVEGLTQTMDRLGEHLMALRLGKS
jgi:uncharacterized protein YndB with AHSA1/START domain